MAIDPSTRLRDCPEQQIGVSMPSPLNARLDALVAQANRAGENTSRKELLAALVLDAPESEERLHELVRRYRLAEAAAAAIEGTPLSHFMEDSASRPPGPRPRRSGTG